MPWPKASPHNSMSWRPPSFGQHAQIGVVNTASQIINAVSKPFIGKIADIISRPTAYLVVLLAYDVGFAIVASCTNLEAYVVGGCLTSFGRPGLDLLSEAVIGDLITLQCVDHTTGIRFLPDPTSVYARQISPARLVQSQHGYHESYWVLPVNLMDSIRSVHRTTTHHDKAYHQGPSVPCCIIHQLLHASGNSSR